MYDLLLSRYHNIDFVLHMDMVDGLELYAKAREIKQKEKRDDRLYQAWVSLYPQFHLKKFEFISWEDYRNRHNTVQLPVIKKSAEELIAEAADIKRQIEGR